MADARMTAREQAGEAQVEALREALDDDAVIWKCCDGEEHSVTMEWDHEPGEYGTVLSSWPVFTVEPPCPGVPGLDADDQGWCPLRDHEDSDPSVENLLGRFAERKRLRALTSTSTKGAE